MPGNPAAFDRLRLAHLHSQHVYYLSSISWSFLCAASISMHELSVSDRGTAVVAWSCSVWWHCGGAGPGGQLIGGGQSTWVTIVEVSEMSTSVSTMSLLLLALHALREEKTNWSGGHPLVSTWHFLAFADAKVKKERKKRNTVCCTYSSSTLLLFFLRHLASQLLPYRKDQVRTINGNTVTDGSISLRQSSYDTKVDAHLFDTCVVLCRWWDALGLPRSNSGRLVGPENEYMLGRKPTSLLAGAEWCIAVRRIIATKRLRLNKPVWTHIRKAGCFLSLLNYMTHTFCFEERSLAFASRHFPYTKLGQPATYQNTTIASSFFYVSGANEVSQSAFIVTGRPCPFPFVLFC